MSSYSLFELLAPVFFIFSAMVSAYVLTDTLKHKSRWYTAISWTIASLIFPLIVIPIYLIFRKRAKHEEQLVNKALNRTTIYVISLYLTITLSIGSVFYYRDYKSFDAHLERANYARLKGQRDKLIYEYSQALQLKDDPHTHKLLAIELLNANQYGKALEEFFIAKKGGEPDESLSFHIAYTLDTLNRKDEALAYYNKFLNSQLCQKPTLNPQCEIAKSLIKKMGITN
jgi:tetratricopeptide (TPR) repeat protein